MKPIVSIGNQDPVIFLSFAAVKGDTYAEVREGIIQILVDLYAKYDYLCQGSALNEKEKSYIFYGVFPY